MPITISGRDASGNYAVREYGPRSADEFKDEIVPGGIEIAKRSMRQIAAPNMEFKFEFPPTSFNHEGYGVSFNEINRPYSTPIVDITSGKSLRCSLEFLVAYAVKTKDGQKTLLDGLIYPIDDRIQVLKEFANFAIPVQFDNFHPSLAETHWYIDTISFSHTRINNRGETTSAQCSMSLIEFKPRSNKMILLPRFQYGKFKPKTKKEGPTGVVPSIDDIVALQTAIANAKTSGSYTSELALINRRING